MGYSDKKTKVNSLCNRDDIQIIDSDVKKAGRAKCDDWRSHIAVRDHLYPEDVGNRPPLKMALH
jgi:hypothetical protein